MKRILFFLSLLFSVLQLYSQTKPTTQISKEAYLLKSKRQKTVATILTASGAALIITSLAIPRGELIYDNPNNPGFIGYGEDKKYKNDDIKKVLSAAGYVSAVTGIAFFFVAS